MLEGLQAIIDFFAMIIDAVKTLISVVQMSASMIISLISLIPPLIGVPVVVLVTICILYKILGRESGG